RHREDVVRGSPGGVRLQPLEEGKPVHPHEAKLAVVQLERRLSDLRAQKAQHALRQRARSRREEEEVSVFGSRLFQELRGDLCEVLRDTSVDASALGALPAN